MYAALTTATRPMATDVGLSQLVKRSPRALPGGTRPDAMAPTTSPSANGVTIDESANRISTGRCARDDSTWPRMTYPIARSTIPTAAIDSGTASVDAIAANAVG